MKGGARKGAGRKKGSGQAAKYRAMLEPHAETLIQQVVDKAKDGDMAALKMCLDRLCAPLKPTDRLITVDGLKDCKSISDKGALILDNLAQGAITPIEASHIITVISNQAKIIELDELEERVASLENKSEFES